MKPLLIIAVAVAILGGFVFAVSAAKDRKAKAWSDAFMAGVERDMEEARCHRLSAAHPNDMTLRELCGRIERLNEISSSR